jgi:hypothetical protein
MNLAHDRRHLASVPRAASRERGVIMLVTLLALVIMLIGAVALVRSFNSSLFMAGNLGFKRDLANQAERAAAVVVQRLETGGLNTVAARGANSTALNYRAQAFTPRLSSDTGCPNLKVNDQGIPCSLLSDTAFAAVGVTANDISVSSQGVTVRYVVDRLCGATGNETTMTNLMLTCTTGPTPDARGGSASDINVAQLRPQVMYRVSIRVDGPRNTQAFFQTTFAL